VRGPSSSSSTTTTSATVAPASSFTPTASNHNAFTSSASNQVTTTTTNIATHSSFTALATTPLNHSSSSVRHVPSTPRPEVRHHMTVLEDDMKNSAMFGSVRRSAGSVKSIGKSVTDQIKVDI
jgi:hypothetical protein